MMTKGLAVAGGRNDNPPWLDDTTHAKSGSKFTTVNRKPSSVEAESVRSGIRAGNKSSATASVAR